MHEILKQGLDHPMQPHGRFGRLAYAGWMLFSSIIALCSIFFLMSLSTSLLLSLLLFLIVISVYAYYSFVFTIRRLHDCNQNGWLSLLGIVPYINFLFGFYLLLASGNKGHNIYGSPYTTQTWEKVFGWIYIILIVTLYIVLISALFYIQELQEQFLQQDFPLVLRQQKTIEL